MKHWRTTLAGAIIAAVEVASSYIEKEEINYRSLGLAVAIAVLGFIARDAVKVDQPKG